MRNMIFIRENEETGFKYMSGKRMSRYSSFGTSRNKCIFRFNSLSRCFERALRISAMIPLQRERRKPSETEARFRSNEKFTLEFNN